MKRWAILLVTVFVTVGGASGWAVMDLRSELDDAREKTRLVGLAKAVADQDAERVRADLRRTRAALEEAEKRLEWAREARREAWRELDIVAEVTDEKFCFNPYDARFSGWVRGPLVADVDGDGAEDRVFTVGRPTLLGRSCRYLVVAETGSGTYAARITGKPLSLHPTSFQLYLAPVAAAQLDDRPGAELLVHVSQGASAHFATLYGLVDGSLVRLQVRGEPSDLISYLGSVSHGSVLNCLDGQLVASSAGRSGPRFVVARSFYELEGATLTRVRKERHLRQFGQWDDFDEFGGHPLSRCEGYVRAPDFPLATEEGSFVTGARARRDKH